MWTLYHNIDVPTKTSDEVPFDLVRILVCVETDGKPQ